ncbi:DUF2069 domain-containing protein [Candidatus Thiothrix sp. Deng01]|uniref:DUF2069 domain-containing protein n=1 Tax=Candidatus Thiothrix phosphatis TaxID=3112415 RepID=A0ABU6D1L0_9GAMM|nr:DUF2069 domain-containing protein [Candidatus Thiothrix sp. Deng01]MEB4592931.1 DUF2069 domain-containing protein [Candidatus Thiothrix sp. Deng01]
MKLLLLWRTLSVGGLLGLIAWIILWNGWLTPIQHMPRWLELLILLAPLLYLVRGILHGRISSSVHAILISLVYATLGVWYAVSPLEQLYGYLMLALSAALYLGSFMSAKVLGKQAKETSS